MKNLNCFLLIFISLTSSQGLAAQELPQAFTFDGRLFSDSSGTTAMNDPNISIRIQILDHAETCILYEETQSGVNTTASSGYFTIQVGSSIGSGKRTNDPGHSMAQVYSNTGGGISGNLVSNGAPCTYTPIAGHQRFVRMTVTPSATGIASTLAPNMPLNSVPSAMVAERAESLQGKVPTDFVQINTVLPADLSQANLENIFSSANYPKLTALLAGTSPLYTKSGANGTTTLPTLSNPASPIAGQVWYDSGAIKFYDGTTTQTLDTSSSGLTSLGGLTGSTQTFASGSAGTAPSMTSAGSVHTLNVPLASGAGVTSGTISKTDYDAFAAKLGTATTLSGDVSGTYNSTVVDQIKGTAVSAVPSAAGQVLRYNGTTAYVPTFLSLADLRSTVTPGNTMFPVTACTASQTLTWSSLTDTMTCSNITIGSSNITDGSIVAADLASSVTDAFWTASSGNVYRATGNVGIGTTNPTQTVYVVGGASTGGETAMVLESTGSDSLATVTLKNDATQWVLSTRGDQNDNFSIRNGGMGRLNIDTAGNVGIGTTSPLGILHTSGDNGKDIYIDGYSGATVNGVGSIYRQARGNAGSPTASQSGDRLFFIGTRGYGATGFGATSTSAIQGFAAESFTDSAMGSYLTFETTATGSISRTERLRISPSGNVGIGTTTPTTKLEVNGVVKATGFDGPMTSTSASVGAGSSGSPSITFTGDTNTGFYNAGSNDTISVTTGGTQIFDFTTNGLTSPTTGGALIKTGNGDATTPTFSFSGDPDTGWFRPAANTMAASTGGTERVRIDASGNIGIGTTTPAAALNVVTTSAVLAPPSARAILGNMIAAPSAASTANFHGTRGITSTSGTFAMAGAYGVTGYASIDGTGAVDAAVGTSGDAVINTTAAVGELKGLQGQAIVNAGSITTAAYGSDVVMEHGTSGTVPLARGGRMVINNTSTGIITTADAVMANVTNSGAGSIGSASALRATVSTTAGSITAFKGLHLDSIPATSGYYSIYSNGAAPSYHAGNFGIGTTTPGTALSFGGSVARTIRMESNPTAASDGNDFSIQAGGSGANADKNGGILYLNGGKSTGDGGSYVAVNVANGGQGPGTTVRDPDKNMAFFDGQHRSILLGQGAYSSTGQYSMLMSLDGSQSYLMTQSNSMSIMGGKVGIGTTAPVTTLDVRGTVSVSGQLSQNLQFDSGWKSVVNGGGFVWTTPTVSDPNLYLGVSNYVTAGSAASVNNRMVIDSSNGRVGIGTSSPTRTLSVDSDSGAGFILRSRAPTASDWPTLITRVHSNGHSGSRPQMVLSASRGTSATSTALASGDSMGVLMSEGHNGTAFSGTASIEFLAAENFAPAAMGTHITFNTIPNGSSSIGERVRITSNGNVGIGTTTPTTGTRLDIYGTGAAASSIIIPRDTVANRPTTGVNGMMRYATDTNKFEAYQNGGWVNMIGGGGAGDFLANGTVAMTGAFRAANGTQALPGISFAGDVDTGFYSTGNNNEIIISLNNNTAGKFGSNAFESYRKVRSANGDATEPNFGGSDDDTGLYFPAAGIAAITTNGTERMRVDGSGNVGIGTSSPSTKLHVFGNLRVQGSTDCTLGNGAGGTNCSSDIRLKTNVQEIENPLEKILSLRGVEFDWNEKSQSPGDHDIGVIAQDVEKQFPTAVIEDSNTGYKKVDYAVLVAPIIQAFKELNKRITVLFSTSEGHSRRLASVEAVSSAKDKEIAQLKARADKAEADAKKQKRENAEMKTRLDKIEKMLKSK